MIANHIWKKLFIATAFLGFLSALSAIANAQTAEPSATPFDFRLMPNEDVPDPLVIESETGTLTKTLLSQKLRVAVVPAYYYYNRHDHSYFAFLPIDLKVAIDGRNPKPYLQNVNAALANWVWNRYADDWAVIQVQFASIRQMGAPQDGSQNQYQLIGISPIYFSVVTKNYDDQNRHVIFSLGMAPSYLGTNNAQQLFEQAQTKFGSTLNPSEIPQEIDSSIKRSPYFTLQIGYDMNQLVSFNIQQEVQYYNATGQYRDGAKATANANQSTTTYRIDTRLDRIFHASKISKMTFGVYHRALNQETKVGPEFYDNSRPTLMLNEGKFNGWGFRLVWTPTRLKNRSQIKNAQFFDSIR